MTLCNLVKRFRGIALGLATAGTIVGCTFDNSALHDIDAPVSDARADIIPADTKEDATQDSKPYDAAPDGMYDAGTDGAGDDANAFDGGIDSMVDSGVDSGADGVAQDAGPNVDDYRHPYGCDPYTIALYHFNSPTPFKDACGTNDATNYGSSAVLRDAEFGDARRFDGVDDYLSAPHTDAMNFSNSNDFTIEAWFRTTNPVGSSAIVSKLSTSITGFEIYYGAGGWACDIEENNHSSKVVAPGALNDGLWHHLACVRSDGGTMLHLYVDGSLGAEGTVTPRNVDSPAPLVIGNTYAGVTANVQWFNGDIDEVRISNVARTYGQ